MHAKSHTIVDWTSRLIAAAILAMGAIPKFTGGAAALAARLPGGYAATLAIGGMEVVAIVLMLVPRTTLWGSGLAAMLMLGAIASHVAGPVGMDGDLATMFAMAVVAFIASAVATYRALARVGAGSSRDAAMGAAPAIAGARG